MNMHLEPGWLPELLISCSVLQLPIIIDPANGSSGSTARGNNTQ